MQRDPLSYLSNTATRIVAGDDRTSYDRTSIALHWLTAVLVLTQFVLAQIWGFAPRPTKHLLIVAHMSFGHNLDGGAPLADPLAPVAWTLNSACIDRVDRACRQGRSLSS